MEYGDVIAFEQAPYVVGKVLKMDFDIVCFSGDKLLGGPQAGIIIGKKTYLKKIKKNHLLRALRCDKINLALLSYTLQQYLYNNTLLENNSTLNLLSRSESQLREMANQLLNLVDIKHHNYLKVINSTGRAGSGAYPVTPIPSFAIQIKTDKLTANQLAKKLRLQKIPLFGYILDNTYHLDFLAIGDNDLDVIGKMLNRVL